MRSVAKKFARSARSANETFKINKDPLNCNSKKVVYLSECKICINTYVCKSQTKFCMRLNDYKTAHKSFKNKKRETQKIFYGTLHSR